MAAPSGVKPFSSINASSSNDSEIKFVDFSSDSEPLGLASLERERESIEGSLAYPEAQQAIRELKQHDRLEECALMKLAYFHHCQSEPLGLASLERECDSIEHSLAYSKAQQAIRELKQHDRFEECALMKLLSKFDKPEDLTKDSRKRNPHLYDEPQENAEFFFADKVGCNLMQWISHLPFEDTSANQLLSTSCFALVVFNAAFFLHHKKEHKSGLSTAEYYNKELMEEMTSNIAALKRGLRESNLSSAQQEDLLTRWVPITEKLSEFTIFLNAFQMKESEFLLLKVIMYTMKAKPDMTEILGIEKLYRGYLDTYCQTHSPSQPNRATDLLKKISEISEVSHNLLLFDTSRLKVPFLICDNRSRSYLRQQ